MNNNKRKTTSSLLVSLIFLMILIQFKQVHAVTMINGFVLDDNDIPIQNSTVSIYRSNELYASTATAVDGSFSIPFISVYNIQIRVSADNPDTGGLDYFPQMRQIYEYDGEPIIFNMEPAATINIVCDPSFVDLEGFVSNPHYSFFISSTNHTLYYTSNSGGTYNIPAFSTFSINAFYTVRSTVQGFRDKEYHLVIDDPLLTSPTIGEYIVCDIQPYLLIYNCELVSTLLNEVHETIIDMSGKGYYLSSEEESVVDAENQLLDGIAYLDAERHHECFSSLKQSYVKLVQTKQIIYSLRVDANTSIYSIVSFLAFSSMVVSFSLIERKAFKITGSILAYLVLLGIFYMVYPACCDIPLNTFVQQSTIPISLSIIVALITPFFLKGRERPDGYVPFRNTISSLFYIARRNLKRRRLRFLLTTTSVTLFIVGFVALTSFTESIGLMTDPVSSYSTGIDGIVVRPKNYSEWGPSYFSERDLVFEWLNQQPEVDFVSMKLESSPRLLISIYLNPEMEYYEDSVNWYAYQQKYGIPMNDLKGMMSIPGYTIHGYIAVKPDLEDNLTNFSSILQSGVLPGENGLLISETLSGHYSMELGDIINIRGCNYTVDGVFSESEMAGLRDIDGSNYRPWGRNELDPSLLPDPVIPRNILVFNYETALNLTEFETSRYAVTLKDGVGAEEFARRITLEKGYWPYVVSSEGVSMYKMEVYSESKGIQLTVPWVIIVLNVALMIINSMYERKNEVQTLSSLGVNPTQIAVIFLLEATIIGLIGGSLGYVTGMSMYKIMSVLGFEIGVHQKISSMWTTASVALAGASSVAGALIALRSSTVITPSHWRRWQYLEEADGYEKPVIIDIPIKVEPGRAEEFAEYMLTTLYSMDTYYSEKKSKVKKEDGILSISFVYTIPHTNITSRTYSTYNVLIIDTTSDDVRVTLESKGEMDSIRMTGDLIRTQAMKWGPVTGAKQKNIDLID